MTSLHKAIALLCALALLLTARAPIAGAAEPTKADRARARNAYAAGVSAYEKGQFQEALARFQEADSLAHRAKLYFNIAACEEQLQHFHAAATMLRRYLDEEPTTTAAERQQIEDRITSLQEMDNFPAGQQPAPNAQPPQAGQAPPPAPPPATPPPAKPKRVITWALAGATGVVALAAVGVGTWALVEHDHLASTCSATGAAGCTRSQVDGVKHEALATDILIGVAGAVAVTTVVMFFVEPRLRRSGAKVSAIPGGVRF